MFYGFNSGSGRCMWSIDHPPVVPEGVVLLSSDESLDINDIMLVTDDDGNYSIGAVVLNDSELLDIAKNKHQSEMTYAKEQIDTLNDVVEFTPSEAATAKLNEWRKYRAELYAVDFTSIETVKWPHRPV